MQLNTRAIRALSAFSGKRKKGLPAYANKVHVMNYRGRVVYTALDAAMCVAIQCPRTPLLEAPVSLVVKTPLPSSAHEDQYVAEGVCVIGAGIVETGPLDAPAQQIANLLDWTVFSPPERIGLDAHMLGTLAAVHERLTGDRSAPIRLW